MVGVVAREVMQYAREQGCDERHLYFVYRMVQILYDLFIYVTLTVVVSSFLGVVNPILLCIFFVSSYDYNITVFFYFQDLLKVYRKYP